MGQVRVRVRVRARVRVRGRVGVRVRATVRAGRTCAHLHELALLAAEVAHDTAAHHASHQADEQPAVHGLGPVALGYGLAHQRGSEHGALEASLGQDGLDHVPLRVRG